ncbi:hypothetical protein [Brevundimonas lenta]|uniref:Uncharacterized protein n=1 Tax=Brevundimonas lenta TaxID=424796 RepID=A0A7W6JAZ9_9CAUL|nr:hypothetical protein [Brevundimonas lenta]MBB4081757.1 hypothetical protein [Brevundimonas lenta]
MTEKTENTAADIAWMRRLAEEGSQTPMQGASILFMAGLLYGSASLFHWAVMTGLLPFTGNALSIGWIVATLLFFVTLAVVINRLKRQPGVVTTANRASDITWSALGWGIFALFSSFAVVGFRMGEAASLAMFALVPSIIMAFYGIGWTVSAVMQKSRPLWALAIGSYIAAPLLAAFAGESVQYLAYAVALFLLMALPGFLLMRAAKRA